MGKNKINLKHLIVASFITALFSLFVGLALYLFTEKSPILTYEVFPITTFKSENRDLNIINIGIDNRGTEEAYDVKSVFSIPNDAKIIDYSVKPSNEAITFKTETHDGKKVEFFFSLINPNESVLFSFLCENITKDDLKIGLRGKGVSGYATAKSEIKADLRFYILYGLLIASFTAGMVFLTMYFLTRPENTNKDA